MPIPAISFPARRARREAPERLAGDQLCELRQAMNVFSDAVHSALSLPGSVHVSSQLPSAASG